METIYLLQSAASPALDSFMMLITNLGHDMTYIALLVVAYLGFGPRQGRNLGLLAAAPALFRSFWREKPAT